MTTAPTPGDVARWMLDTLRAAGMLYQDDVAYRIQTEFGGQFVYDNENGNLAIARAVLKEFRKVSDDNVVWERGDRCWRWREPFDEPGRMQD